MSIQKLKVVLKKQTFAKTYRNKTRKKLQNELLREKLTN